MLRVCLLVVVVFAFLLSMIWRVDHRIRGAFFLRLLCCFLILEARRMGVGRSLVEGRIGLGYWWIWSGLVEDSMTADCLLEVVRSVVVL